MYLEIAFKCWIDSTNVEAIIFSFFFVEFLWMGMLLVEKLNVYLYQLLHLRFKIRKCVCKVLFYYLGPTFISKYSTCLHLFKFFFIIIFSIWFYFWASSRNLYLKKMTNQNFSKNTKNFDEKLWKNVCFAMLFACSKIQSLVCFIRKKNMSKQQEVSMLGLFAFAAQNIAFSIYLVFSFFICYECDYINSWQRSVYVLSLFS